MKADEQQGKYIDAQGYYLAPIDIFIEASFREFCQWFNENYPTVRLKIKNKDSFELAFINSLAFSGEISLKPENNGIRILGFVRTLKDNNWASTFSEQCGRYFEPQRPQKKKSRAEEIIEELPDGDKKLALKIMNKYLAGEDYGLIAYSVEVSRSTVYRWLVKLELIKSRKKI